MKKKLKKLFNNRIFRTFIQTFISSIAVYFSSTTILDINMDAMICLLVSALSTGLAAIMPLLNEGGEN